MQKTKTFGKVKTLQLDCKGCKNVYEVPNTYLVYNKTHPCTFYKTALDYCGKCRKSKMKEVFENGKV